MKLDNELHAAREG